MMKPSHNFSNRGKGIPTCRVSQGCVAAVLAVFIGITGSPACGQTPPPDHEVAGAQVLTRGPVHEAFAGMVTFNPEPGVVVTQAPPDLIEEVPPEERPAGDSVSWIPGYWSWDDERGDFLWVSGTWRALPPGREWRAGYWGRTPQGHQWISGYWADAAVQETTYLPPPPVTVEAGPNVAAPSLDYGWTPGCWIWYQGRYAWRPGYWAQGRADWDWVPAYYVWSPRGYIFAGGFWDYPVARRGVLFAPVYFSSGLHLRRGYHYSPTIVIELGVFTDHLFLRPRYSHYYFGDYYAASYHQGGFYTSFSFQSSRHGYDPIYAHQRWEHRRDQEWEPRVQASYQYRRDHETARPPHTWADQRNINPSTAESKQNRVLVAAPIDQLAKRKDSPLRFQPVAQEERHKLAQRGQAVQKSRDQRRTVEAKTAAPAARPPGGVIAPAKVQLPRSPIVARPANQLGRSQAPPKAQQAPKPDLKFQPKAQQAPKPDLKFPPKAQQAPKPDLKFPPKAQQAPKPQLAPPPRTEPAGRPPNVGRGQPRSEPRPPEIKKQPAPGRSEAAPRGKPDQTEKERGKKEPR